MICFHIFFLVNVMRLAAQRCASSQRGAGTGVDSAWEQYKPEAWKMPENDAESHLSAARFVGLLLLWDTS
jgi:DNA-binding FadR family transcriptional regulator